MKYILIVILLVISSYAELSSQWLPDIKITNSNARSFTCFNNAKGVAVNGSFVHLVWFDERIITNREIYYRRSTNYGSSFESDVRLTDSIGASEDACIALVGTSIHVLWKDSRNGNTEIYYKRSTNNGSTWSNDVRLTNNSSYSLYPSLSASGNFIHAVWEEYRDNGATGEIYYKRSSDNGETWSADINLTNNSFHSLYPSVCSRDLNVYITWCDTRDGNKEIYFKHSSDGGLNWGADTRLTNNAGASDDASISVSGSVIHVAWKDNRDGNLEAYYKRSVNGGLSWESDVRLSTTNGQTWYTSVAASGQNVHLVYNDYTNGALLFHCRSSNGGISWNTYQLSNHNLGEFRPSIIMQDTAVYIVWTDTRDQGASHEEVYYKRNPTGLMSIINISNSVPLDYSIKQNYPNPFNPVTNIEFSLIKQGIVKLSIFDILGREIAVLVDEELSIGTYKVDWNASGLPSGIYFCKLETGSFSGIRKMILSK